MTGPYRRGVRWLPVLALAAAMLLAVAPMMEAAAVKRHSQSPAKPSAGAAGQDASPVERPASSPGPAKPSGGHARGGPPFTPKHVDESQGANVTTPCCTFAFVRLNATDPDGTGFYDGALVFAVANGSSPARAATPGYRGIDPRVVWLPNGSWAVEVRARGWDSTVSDSFDRLDADANFTLVFRSTYVGLRVNVRCDDRTQFAPGPESCV